MTEITHRDAQTQAALAVLAHLPPEQHANVMAHMTAVPPATWSHVYMPLIIQAISVAQPDFFSPERYEQLRQHWHVSHLPRDAGHVISWLRRRIVAMGGASPVHDFAEYSMPTTDLLLALPGLQTMGSAG